VRSEGLCGVQKVLQACPGEPGFQRVRRVAKLLAD
jgi:hypothetical protein